MKYKIFLVLAMVLFAVFGFNEVTSCWHVYKELKAIVDQCETKSNTLKALQASNLQIEEDLNTQGIVLPNSNQEVAEQISSLDGASLISITAQRQESGSTNLIDITTIDNITDVSFFTNTVDKMLFTLEINDYEKMFVSLSRVNVNFDYIDVSKDTSLLVLRVNTIDGSPTSNDAVTVPTETSSSEAKVTDFENESKVKNEDTSSPNLEDVQEVDSEVLDDSDLKEPNPSDFVDFDDGSGKLEEGVN